MGSWYWIGVAVGLGVADGVLANSGLGLWQGGFVFRAVGSIVGGTICGFLVHLIGAGLLGELIAGALGGLLGFLGSVQVISGALRRGGTRGGIAIIVAGAVLVLAGLAFVPALGYLEAVALPALGALLRRRRPERYAGLRTLAKD